MDTSSADLRREIADLRDRLSAAEASHDAVLAEAKRALHRMRHYEAILETVPVGIVLADENGQIFHGNSHVETMVRHPVLNSADVDSYGEWVSYHEDGRRVESHEYPLARVLRDGEPRAELDVHYQRGDGTRFWMRIIGEPVFDEEGKRVGASVALVDIDRERSLIDQQRLLTAELNHRVKNVFNVVKSIVMQSLRKASLPPSLRDDLDARLHAYSLAHARLLGRDWERASLSEIAREMVEGVGSGRLSISGPEIGLPSRATLAMAMALYELATNAVKYGALSRESGRVDLSWSVTEAAGGDRELSVAWVEQGGPPVVGPREKGFGSTVTGRALALATGGTVDADFDRKGLRWRLVMPLQDGSRDEE